MTFNLFYITVPYFKLNLTFDLVSENIVENIYLKPKIQNKYQTVYSLQIIQKIWHIFYIKVSKFQHIHIMFNTSLKSTVHDGPGSLSESHNI